MRGGTFVGVYKMCKIVSANDPLNGGSIERNGCKLPIIFNQLVRCKRMCFAQLTLFNGFAEVYRMGATTILRYIINRPFARIGFFKAYNTVIVVMQQKRRSIDEQVGHQKEKGIAYYANSSLQSYCNIVAKVVDV